jgi:hypothetical protein
MKPGGSWLAEPIAASGVGFASGAGRIGGNLSSFAGGVLGLLALRRHVPR